MRKKAKEKIIVTVIKILFCMLVCSFVIQNGFSDVVIFDMEDANPVGNGWIGGKGEGNQTYRLDNNIFKMGKASLKWEYALPSNPEGNYPTIEFNVPIKQQNFREYTRIGMWIYFDLIAPKTYWTIQPTLCHPFPSNFTDLGNWNAGEKGVLNETWVYNEWQIPPNIDISKVTHIRLHFHAGDGWNEFAKLNKVTIYIDNVTLIKGNTEMPSKDKINILEQEKIFHLGFGKDENTGKAICTLNGTPFYPVAYFTGFHSVSSEFIDRIRDLGCNSILITMDAIQAGSSGLKNALRICYEKKIPTFVEIALCEYWVLLKKNLDLNIVMYDGTPVKHFPDYTNPRAKEEHISRYRKASEFLKDYANRPVIGICVGAYDDYHLPDGEIHVAFEVPGHKEKYETFLPYGKWAKGEFIQYLKISNISPEKIGYNSYDEISTLPISPQTAKNSEEWYQWILFRRYIVKKWLAETVEAVRTASGLPVTVTFDINFSREEKFATPPFYWSDILDFVIVYYYGRIKASDYIPPLLRSVYKPFNDAGKPILTLLEFSSALSGSSPGDEYAKASAPYVVGMLVTGPNPSLKHTQDRIESFCDWIKNSEENIVSMKPESTDNLILVDKGAIYFENNFASVLSNLNIPYDIKYVSIDDEEINLNGYNNILIPDNFNTEIVSKLPKTKNIIFEKKDWLNKLRVKDIIKFDIRDVKKGELLFEDNFNQVNSDKWEFAIDPESWKIENGKIRIKKEGQNVRGIVSKMAFSPPFMLETSISFGKGGRSRISFLDAVGYSISMSGEEPNDETKELSIGANPLNDKKGEFGVYFGGWIGFTDIDLNKFYTLELKILPYDNNKDVLYFELYKTDEGKEKGNIGNCTYFIPKRTQDRLWLMWAFDNADAIIDDIKVYKISK